MTTSGAGAAGRDDPAWPGGGVANSGAAPVGGRAWIELLHAEVCWTLAGAGVDALVIKGPSTAQWLYPDGARESADVDLLVRPSHWEAAVQALCERGFGLTYDGVREGETSLHSLDLHRTDPALGRHGVDLHRHFPGLATDPALAFEGLWSRRVEAAQAGVPVWFPDLAGRALLVVMHVARSPGQAKPLEDLRRAVAALPLEGWQEVRELASSLGGAEGLGALRVGLEMVPEAAPPSSNAAAGPAPATAAAAAELSGAARAYARAAPDNPGRALVAELGLANVDVAPYWQLRATGADRTAVRLEQLRKLPRRRRPGQVLRWVVPTPALMRVRDPSATTPPRLARAYARRLGEGVRRLPGAVRQYRTARRGP